jgi:hypothetical protein
MKCKSSGIEIENKFLNAESQKPKVDVFLPSGFRYALNAKS